jgi:7-cyano-7-deazaguanine synthase in queuosine biosynthesis
MTSKRYTVACPEKLIDVVERGGKPRRERDALTLETDVSFSTEALESYAFARWQPVIYDAMVVAAAVEYADKTCIRPTHGWARRFDLQILVDDPGRWNAPDVSVALVNALSFLTGDHWTIHFVRRKRSAPAPSKSYLSLSTETSAILAFSDGLDSRAVAGIVGKKLGGKLVRVRVGSKAADRPRKNGGQVEPFTSVPYSLSLPGRNKETSARTRGFKFSLITALAAYLTEATDIVVPESGQGALGPALLSVGHIYPDYRNHPLFLMRMTKFVSALLGRDFRYTFPRIWATKGETLKEFLALGADDSWAATKSCWRGSQWSSVDGKLRQCGVCAACMLRRVSVHAAGLQEKSDTYVCSDMTATTLKGGVDGRFEKINAAYEQYAIAGTLHMDHLADMASKDAAPIVRRHAALIGSALGLTHQDAEQRLTSLLQRHADEWMNFLRAQGSDSFLRHWVRTEP